MIGNLGSRLSTNRIIREVSKDADVPLIDVQALFQQYGASRQRFYNRDLIHDDCHPTPLGHQLIAEALVPLLQAAITSRHNP
jgi:lysophospholipase L1-like esterase